jgi:hypothetical protein
MGVSSAPALTAHNRAIYACGGVVEKAEIAVGKWPLACVEIVDGLWVTRNFSR